MPFFAPGDAGGEGGGFNYGSASEGALSDITGAGSGQPPAQAPVVPAGSGTPAPVVGQPGQAAVAPGSATAVPAGTASGGEPLYDVTVNGRTFKVPLSELRSGYSRQSDYTQKTMALSEKERQWSDYIQKLETAYGQLQKNWNDPRVQAYVQSLSVQARPDEPLTLEQQQRLLAQERQAQEQGLTQKFNEFTEQAQIQVLATQYNADLDNTLTRVLEAPQYELLKDIPGIKTVLWQAMTERQPGSIQEAKQFLVEAAQNVHQSLTARFQEKQKRDAALAAQKLSGIERPGGAQPPAVPQQPGWKLGDKDLRSAAIADVMATMNR